MFSSGYFPKSYFPGEYFPPVVVSVEATDAALAEFFLESSYFSTHGLIPSYRSEVFIEPSHKTG